MTHLLRVGKGSTFDMPLDAVTQTFAILAVRGRGKTYTGSVMTEQMICAGQPVVVIDPLGVWWGLRSSVSGKKKGLPVAILGGKHGDAPLTSTSGTVIADLVVSQRVPLVLDLSGFDTKAEEIRFTTDFLTRLYQKNSEPLHLMIDEADVFAPQQVFPEGKRLLHAMEQVVRRGRARGLGVTLISQRAAVLNKNVLSQTETLILLGMTGANDLKAIDEWVGKNADFGEAREIMGTLPGLPIGTAWVWSPAWLGITRKVEIRSRVTFDSSATPKVGDRRVEPTEFADIDMAALTQAIEASAEKVSGEDPKVLRQRLREAEAKVAALEADLAREQAKETETVEVEVPVLGDSDRTLLDQALLANERLSDALLDLTERLRVNAFERQQAKVSPAPVPRPLRTPLVRDLLPPRPPSVSPPKAESNGSLSKAERSILTVLAQFGAPDGYDEGVEVKRLAILSGYTAGGGGFNNALSSLRTAGRIERGNPVRITPQGLADLGEYEQLPRGWDLFEFHAGRHKLGKAHREIVGVLYEAYPQGLSAEEIASRTPSEYKAGTGGFNNALSRLRTLGLIETTGGLTVLAEEMVEEYS